MLRLLIFTLLILGATAKSNSCVGNNTTQRQILMTFYNTTNGPNWIIPPHTIGVQWTTTLDYCQWAGVTCWEPSFDGCDTMVYLLIGNFGLNGYVPESLSKLSVLGLDLSRNPLLYGSLPNNLFATMPVRYLYLYSTGITGDLPNFGSPCDLTTLEISNTNITSIDVHNCLNLRQVIMDNTLVSGHR